MEIRIKGTVPNRKGVPTRMSIIKRDLVFFAAFVFLCLASVSRGEGADGAEAGEIAHALTRFRFSRGGYMVPETCEILFEDGNYTICYDGGASRPLDAAFAGELLKIIEDCGLGAWDGFRGSDPDVLDGEGFSLEMEYDDGAAVYASGENRFPAGYHDTVARLASLFEREKMSHLAGEYRYEGEGFGGDFTLTLNADGTYTFYEGMLSSYMGGGKWSVESSAVFLSEENGLDALFVFGVGEDELIYLEMGSAPFPYVRVKDGERFVRRDAAPAGR